MSCALIAGVPETALLSHVSPRGSVPQVAPWVRTKQIYVPIVYHLTSPHTNQA